jgi:hypothetical protein
LLKALQNGYRARFIRAQDLFDEMYASLADRASRKLVRRLARIDLLLVDGLAYLNLRPEQTNIFFRSSGFVVGKSRSAELKKGEDMDRRRSRSCCGKVENVLYFPSFP